MMNLLSLAAKVDALTLRSYLSSRNWVEHPSRRDYVAIYRTKDDRAEVVVPLDRALADYHHAVVIVAKRIAEREERTAEQVLKDLLHARMDVVRFGLTGLGTVSGSVDMVSGVALAAGALHALRASASCVERPQKYHPRMTLADSEALVKACRFGQTEVGSFILTVEVPLESSQILLGIDGSLPFGRRTTHHLLKATHELVQALSTGSVMRLVEQDDSPVSANLCDAIVEMAPRDESLDIQIEGAWSPSIPPPGVKSSVVVEKSMFEEIAALGDYLRPASDTAQTFFVGRITDLHGERGPSGIQGDVTMRAQVGSSLMALKFHLEHQDYLEAVTAHGQEDHVRVQGTLHRRPRSNYLTGVTGFRRLTAE